MFQDTIIIFNSLNNEVLLQIKPRFPSKKFKRQF